MPANTVLLKIDASGVAETLRECAGKVDAEGEVMVDFTSVERVDPAALRAMEKLASAAEGKAARVVLCGVSAGVYKALKLAKLAPKFVFMS